MKIKKVILAMGCFMSLCGQATEVEKNIACHDQFLEKNSTTFLTATIQSSNLLSKVEITPGKMLNLNVTSLSIARMNLGTNTFGGIETLSAGIHADRFQIVTPLGAIVDHSYSVIFALGSKWLESLEKGYIVAQIQFYPDEAGGFAPFRYNMYCVQK